MDVVAMKPMQSQDAHLNVPDTVRADIRRKKRRIDTLIKPEATQKVTSMARTYFRCMTKKRGSISQMCLLKLYTSVAGERQGLCKSYALIVAYIWEQVLLRQR